MVWPVQSRRERVRKEAASWVVALSEEVDGAERARFERWYQASKEHAEAYDRIASRFEAASALRRQTVRETVAQSHSRDRAPSRHHAFGAAFACAALLVLVIIFRPWEGATPLPLLQTARYSTSPAESRRILLADGSTVLLSGGSRLEVALDKAARRLRLTTGEARFSVAHEARPFIVAADGAQVVAHGTQFVVRVSEGKTTVSLIEGSVEVTYGAAGGKESRRQVARLKPGQRLILARQEKLAPPPARETASARSGPAMLQFDDTPLGEAVREADRHGLTQIRIDPAVASLRVTGAFRAGDTEGLAQSLAAAFHLEVDRSIAGVLLLRPQLGSTKQP